MENISLSHCAPFFSLLFFALEITFSRHHFFILFFLLFTSCRCRDSHRRALSIHARDHLSEEKKKKIDCHFFLLFLSFFFFMALRLIYRVQTRVIMLIVGLLGDGKCAHTRVAVEATETKRETHNREIASSKDLAWFCSVKG